MDSLLEMQKSATSEINRRRVENLRMRVNMDKSFEPFQNVCSSQWLAQKNT